jgi:uncharacterized protein (DUF362 family)
MRSSLDSRVAIALTGLSDYPRRAPFDPPERYPELRAAATDPDNRVYPAVRDLLFRLGLDRDNYGSPRWNPLAGIVEPGMTVLVKPNLVRHDNLSGQSALAMITHASVVRPLLDYVSLALNGRGRIVVADAPMLFGDFPEILSVSQLGPLIDAYRREATVPIECFDLRSLKAASATGLGHWGRKPVREDPAGHRWVDLGERSQFAGIDPARLRIGVAYSREMLSRHSNGRHEYLLSGTVLQSDAIISIPKLKTHRRTGVTLAMKASFGLLAGRGTLPHYQLGSVAEGGDEYVHPSARKRLRTSLNDALHGTSFVPLQLAYAVTKTLIWKSGRIVPFSDPIEDGMWNGNDTLWRAVLDVQHAAYYADASGRLRDTPQRTHFALIDGIVGGEGNGPISPDPKPAGALVGGTVPCVVDTAAASLMGFDVERIPVLVQGMRELEQGDPGVGDRVRAVVGEEELTPAELRARHELGFKPHPNWPGLVEKR